MAITLPWILPWKGWLWTTNTPFIVEPFNNDFLRAVEGLYRGVISLGKLRLKWITCYLYEVFRSSGDMISCFNHAAPTGPPLNVRGVGVSSSSIALAWDEVMFDKRNGRIILYEVKYHQAGGSFAGSLNTTERLVFINNLLPATSYEFTVQAFTENGRGPDSDVRLVGTLEEPMYVLTGPPLNLRVIGTTLTSISLEWEEVDVDEGNGEIVLYEVVFESHQMRGEVNTSNTSVTLNDLLELTTYEVRVQAYTSDGPGPYSDVVSVMTKEDSKTSF